MDRTERFYKIDTLLRQRKAISFAGLLYELEVLCSTLKPDLTTGYDRQQAAQLCGPHQDSSQDRWPRCVGASE